MLTYPDFSNPIDEDLLGQAITRAPMGFMLFDLRGRLLQANQRVAERLGYSKEQLVGLTLRELDCELSDAALDALLERLASRVGDRPEILLTHHRDARGESFPVEVRLAAIEIDGRARIVMLATAITDSLAAERQLQEKERLFNQVFHASEDAILLLDDDHFIDCNEAAVRMLGCSSKTDILHSPPWSLSPEFQPDGRLSTEKAREVIEQAYQKHFHRFEWVHRRANGEDFPVEVTLTLVELAGRQILHVIWNDITERKADEKRIEALARYDMLTGLPNRRLLQENAARAIAESARTNRPVGVMYMDLDRFKDINDTQGHETGDRMLAEVSARLRTCLDDEHSVARLGGDEFAFVLPDTDIVAMQALAARIVEMMEEPFTINGISTRIGASIGLVSYPEHGRDLAELLKHADIAMYRAKESQEGWCLFAPEQAFNVLERVNLERELREVITERKLTLHYQPIIDAHTGLPCCVEALARWPRHNGEVVPTQLFITMAETTGLIQPLSELLLETVCEQARAWRRQGLAIPIAVNLSARELQAPDLADRVLATLERYGLDGSALEIEVTETTVMSHDFDTVATLSRLKQQGIRIFIDDFGTGYSSLSQLKRLPVDVLKVDQSFVRDMVSDPADAKIVETIVLLAGAMDLQTVAEGIETEAQFRAARMLGCDFVQGYLFARPASGADITPLLERGRFELPPTD
jgi:diguanylate cyclase (GGDEF)-like protein/PAS domain S-box-containing protein